MDNSVSEEEPASIHLERLFLVAQFITQDADQAALLVDRVFKSTSPNAGAVERSLPALIDRLVSLNDAIGVGGELTETQSVFSNQARRSECDRFLSRQVRLEFLLLPPMERLELWRCIERGSSYLSGDALDRFTARVASTMSPEQLRVFGDQVVRESVGAALRGFWNSAFVPVPPTLRSVVESTERRQNPDTPARHGRETARRPVQRTGSRLNRLLLYTWVILAAGVVGYLLTRAGEPTPPSTDILELSRSAVDDVDITFQTGNAEQAERFIADRFGWRLSTPEISRASLVGISLATLVDEIELPVLVFSNEEDASEFPVFTFSYSFLEAHSDHLALGRGTLRQIQNTAGFDIHEFRGRAAVVWRDRDDIFVAFVVGDGTEFQSRVLVRS